MQIEKTQVCFVDDDFTETTDGWKIDHFQSIQDAIDVVERPAKIYINEGIYTECIFIDNPGYYQIIGEGADKTIITGDHTQDDVIRVNSKSRINLTGCTIQESNSSNMSSCYDAGLHLASDNNKITGNIFKNNACGIYMLYATKNCIDDNLFKHNYYGLLLYTGSNENHIVNNIISENRIGCKLKGSNENFLHHNQFSNNVGGISLCCLSYDNLFYANLFLTNTEFHTQDWCVNKWNNSDCGNFWDNFCKDSQGAYDENHDGIVDSPYLITQNVQEETYPNKDFLPLRNEPVIENRFLTVRYY
jgi:parallel beta-helix repeat protein